MTSDISAATILLLVMMCMSQVQANHKQTGSEQGPVFIWDYQVFRYLRRKSQEKLESSFVHNVFSTDDRSRKTKLN
jgi:hypothetical protein